MRHLSDIKNFERCKKKFWNALHHPQPFYPFVIYNESMVALVQEKLHAKQCFIGSRNETNEMFFKQEKNYDTFFNVRFVYDGLRVKAPLLRKTKYGYILSFLYASCFPKESEATTIADTLWVLEKLQIKISQVSVFHLVSTYVRQDQLIADALLQEVTHLYNASNKPSASLQQLIEKRKRDVSPILKAMKKVEVCKDMPVERTPLCTRRNKCVFFDMCFAEDAHTSIFHLVSSAHKFSLYKQGIHYIEDIDFSQIEGTRHQYAQYMAARSDKCFFDQPALHKFVSDIQYPISYLDFEWETFAFPPYANMKPYDVLVFQYSLHIEHQHQQALLHKEFLGKEDCRVAFIEQLLADIPKTGSILCFNVEGAEKLRLCQLAKQYPQYAKQLQAIWERMVDLAIPFSSGLIYDNKMAGSYSLKKLVSIFTDYSYEDLAISHGLQAVQSYKGLESDENEKVVENLLQYCAMDTYAMYLLFHWIKKQLME
ncbi:MAG: DUF2779 domain-containing protein [Breznakia sp.]